MSKNSDKKNSQATEEQTEVSNATILHAIQELVTEVKGLKEQIRILKMNNATISANRR